MGRKHLDSQELNATSPRTGQRTVNRMQTASHITPDIRLPYYLLEFHVPDNIMKVMSIRSVNQTHV